MTQATLVTPGKHMLPPDLCDTACFDALRKAHLVWIVQEKPNIIHIYSRTLRDLQEGFKEVNWAIHDMRIAQYNVSSLFLVQLPLVGECSITVDLGCRPQTSPRTPSEQLVPVQDISHITNGLMKELRPNFLSSTDTLQSRLKQTLQMRVDFGHVKIRLRKKIKQGNENGNEMPYAEFTAMTSQYGKRGGADFEGKLEGPRLASNTIRHLLQPTVGFFNNHQELICHDTILLKLQNRTLEADIEWKNSGPAVLTNAHLMEPDLCPPLKWTVLAPDMKYDWCFRVDSGRTILPIDPQELKLIASIVINSEPHEVSTGEAFLQKPMSIKIKDPQLWRGKVDKILLRSTVAIPFRDTPYVMGVSSNRVWQGVDTHADPQSWQSLAFYGVHWAAELNSTNATGTRKDWGVHQKDVWRGSAETAEGQFEEFIRYVLEGLLALDGLQT